MGDVIGGATWCSVLDTHRPLALFTIVNNDGVDPVLGIFAQGVTIMAGSQLFAIDYVGGTGNDIVLTAIDVPEPSTTAMISAAAALLLALQCWRRRRLARIFSRLVIIAR
jgi:hypothetical protein